MSCLLLKLMVIELLFLKNVATNIRSVFFLCQPGNLLVEFPNAFPNAYLFVLLAHPSGWLVEFRDMVKSVSAEGIETDVS